jgi:TetR/AcrR family transcriptional regulator, repressor of the ameABC operon
MDRSQTYERIVEKADTLFRRFGYMKTPVADIARELNMSSANIYKFFPSKRAIIEAVGQRRLLDLRKQLLVATKTRKSAFERIKDLIRAVVHHFEIIIEEESDLMYIEVMQDVLRFEIARRKEDWKFPKEVRHFLVTEVTQLIKEGVSSGEMHVDDLTETVEALLDCLCRVLEPVLLLEDAKPLRAERLERQFRFLARALA